MIISSIPILRIRPCTFRVRNDNPELFMFNTFISITSDYQLDILDSCGTRIEWANLTGWDWRYDGQLSLLILVGYMNLCIYSYN